MNPPFISYETPLKIVCFPIKIPFSRSVRRQGALERALDASESAKTGLEIRASEAENTIGRRIFFYTFAKLGSQRFFF
jgi:hypothetical protein